MKMRTFKHAAPLGLLLLLPSIASADFFQAPFGPGGTWNVYETVGTAATFKDALANANAKVDPVSGTVHGTLASVVSQNENTFLNKTVLNNSDSWIGLTDREGVAVGAQESQTAGSPGNQSSGWAWTSGEPFVYKNWNGGEPNNAGDAEDAGQLTGGGGWNDNASGYGLNQPITPVLQAGTSQAEGSTTFNYVVEYFTQSATPLAGVRLGSVLTAPGSIPGPSGGVGTWGVREVSGITVAGNIVDAVNQLKAGGGTSITAQLPKLDVADPQSNVDGGPNIKTPPLPFLSNTAANDDNLATIAKGTINITQAGTYTFQVHSDDGFAMRVVGQKFDSVNGNGYLDPVDNSTMAFNVGTGDSDTRGIITLAAGKYDVEFVHFEGGGGAYYELTSAQGAITSASGAQWTAVGDTTVKAALPSTDVVRLTAAATVTNAAKPGDNNLATAMAAVDSAITAGTAVSKTFSTLTVSEADMPIANKDNYATKVTGQLKLDNSNGTPGENLKITFNLQCDDGASLQIIGKSFTAVNDFTGDGTAVLANVNGDQILKADYPTGNTNAFGVIELTEGQLYNFLAYHSEGGGGSQFQLWWALGDYTATGFDASAFHLLSVGQDLAANAGIGLVPEPSITGLAGLASLGLLARRKRK